MLFQQSVLCYHFYFIIIYFITKIFLNFKGEQFTTSRAFTRHNKEVHTEDKPYKSGICGKTFKNESSMRIHEMTHTREQPGTSSNRYTKR